jgi:hypothetical protein
MVYFQPLSVEKYQLRKVSLLVHKILFFNNCKKDPIPFVRNGVFGDYFTDQPF